eukprot:PhM_4_TR5904/c0_g1_i1/m.7656
MPTDSTESAATFPIVLFPSSQWAQTIDEVTLSLHLQTNDIRARDLNVKITARSLCVQCKAETLLEGNLLHAIDASESTWQLDQAPHINKNVVVIILSLVKAIRDPTHPSCCWGSVFSDGRWAADEDVLDKTRRSLTLERYQREHPSFDFSQAEVTGYYSHGGHHVHHV